MAEIRTAYLQDALKSAVSALSVPEVDRELAKIVPERSLAILAAHGLRGEMMFPVPLVIRANPRLLAYYRLLYGYSRKEFYTAATGFGRLCGLEDRGVIGTNVEALVPEACQALCHAGATLLAAISHRSVSAALLDDLSLLTLGPQLRGSANVQKGTAGIRTVFNAIAEIVNGAVTSTTDQRMKSADELEERCRSNGADRIRA